MSKDNLAFDNLELGFGVAPEQVLAPSHPLVDFVLQAVLVTVELAVDPDALGVLASDLDVRD